MVDLSNISDADLVAFQENRLSDVSDAGLFVLKDVGMAAPSPALMPENDPDNIAILPDSVERGLAKVPYSVDFAAHGLGLKSDEDFAEDTARLAKKLRSLPMSERSIEGLEEIYASESVGGFIKNLVMNPTSVGNLVGESVGSMAGGVAAGTAFALGAGKLKLPVWGARLISGGIFGAGSGGIEAASSFFGDLAMNDVDVENPESVQEALEDTELVSAMRKKAVARGVPVAAFDAFTASVAGIPFKMFTKSGLTRTTVGLGAGLELGVQGAGGALGEAGAQVLSEGSITDPISIGLEAALEIITGGPQAAFQTLTIDGLKNPISDTIREAFVTSDMKKALGDTPLEESVLGPAVPEGETGDLDLGLQAPKVRKTEAVGSREEATELSSTDEAQAELFEGATPQPKEVVGLAQNAVKDLRKQLRQTRKVLKTDPKNDMMKTREQFLKSEIKTTESSLSAFLDQNNLTVTKKGVVRNKPVRKAPQKLTEAPTDVSTTTPTQEPLEGLKTATLPKHLAKGTPQYSPGGIKHFLEFENDLAKAIYISGSRKPSARRSEYDAWLQEQGLSRKDVVEANKAIKEDLGTQSKAGKVDVVAKLPESAKAKLLPTTTPEIKGQPTSKDGIQAPRPTSVKDQHFNETFSPQLKALRLLPKSQELLKPAMRNLEKIARRVGGPKVDVNFVDRLYKIDEATDQSQMLRGAQIANVTVVAMQNTDVTETQYHELWHFLEENGAFEGTKIKEVLDRDLHLFKDYIVDKMGLPDGEFETFIATPEGIKEMRATVFGQLAAEWDTAGKASNGAMKGSLSRESYSILQKAWKMLQDMFDAIRGTGLTLEDVFIDSFEGKHALDEVLAYGQNLRLQKIQAGAQANHQEYAYDTEKHSEGLKQAVKDQNQLGELNAWAHKASSKWGLARNNPAFSKVYDVAESMQERGHEYLNKYQRNMDGYSRLPRDVRYGIANIAAHNKNADQKAWLDDLGRLHFVRDGKEIRIDNLEASRQYMKLQEAMQDVLNDNEQYYRRQVQKEFKTLGRNFSTKDLEAIKNDSKTSKSQGEKIDRIIKNLTSFTNMRRSDFVPAMRFGKWGLAVYIKDGVDAKGKPKKRLVDFRKIDAGKGKNDLHMEQLDDIRKDFKEKYSDPKYIVTGADGKRIKDFDNLTPFLATKDNMSSIVDPSVLTLDMISEIMHSDKMDAAEYGKYRDELFADLTTRSFNKRFAKSDDIAGFSQDWDRVFASYHHGASKFLSSIEHQPLLSNIAKETSKLKDDTLKKGIQDFIKYIQEPQEDLQNLRAFNFFWTMGFNASSAALQYMTLPTVTAGQLASYDGSIIKNMARISKWASYGADFIKNGAVTFKDFGLVLDITNEKTWAAIRKKNPKLDDATFESMKNLAISQYRKGNIGAVEIQESSGPTLVGKVTPSERFSDYMRKGVQASGSMIAFAEQNTRFATLMAVAEQQYTDPKARERADRILSNESIYLDRKARNPGASIADHVSIQTLHNAHAVFGKIGRADVFKSYGGALIVPFMTWSHQMWGLMSQMAVGRGKEGRVGLYITLGLMMGLSGLVGLPGGELLKELFEAFYKTIKEEEIDLDETIRRALDGSTGIRGLGTFVNHGALRKFTGLDVSKRTGLPVPGQEILLTLMGTKKDPSALIGVQGSMIGGVARAFESYNNQAGVAAISQDLLPVAFSNIAKAIQYTQEGVTTRGGKTQLIAESDVTTKMIVSRILGVSDAKLAEAREKQFFAQTLERQHKPAYNKYKRRMENHLTRYKRARMKGNQKEALKHKARYDETMEEFSEWSKRSKYLVPWGSVFRTVSDKVASRFDTDIDPMKFNKSARQSIDEMVKGYQ